MARAMAIASMFAAHVGPKDRYGIAGRLIYQMDGLAPVLFVLVAGIGVSLLVPGTVGSHAPARVRLVWTAFVLFVSGLVLQTLDHNIYVILHHFTPLFLTGALLAVAGDRLLLIGGSVLTIVGPCIFYTGLMINPELFDKSTVSIMNSWGEIVHRIMLSGAYPYVTYIGVFMLGMWLGRHEFQRESFRKNLLLRGLMISFFAYAAAFMFEHLVALPGSGPGWESIGITVPHSQMPLWVIAHLGVALAILGLCLMIAHRFKGGLYAWVAMGQMALTLYVLQIVVFHYFLQVMAGMSVWEGYRNTGLMVLASLFIAHFWMRYVGIGPLEYVFRLKWFKPFRQWEGRKRSSAGI